MRRFAFALTMLLPLSVAFGARAAEPAAGNAAIAWPAGNIDSWHGLVRHHFTVDGCPAWVVVPKRPLPGNPWSWCMEFPDAFTERCAAPALLAKGFHHVHIVVGNTFGCPDAVKHFNAFYDVLRSRGLAEKAALIGLSRGGLYAYRWAAQNPDKVAVIYGDAPVCDFKSWPGGKGKGKGSPGDWRDLWRCYGFADEAAAMAYRGNPIDTLAPLAKAGVALIHVVGDVDESVPAEENTAIVESRYRKLGGTVRVIHKPGVGHHPHGLEDPSPVVEFIVEHAAKAAQTAGAKTATNGRAAAPKWTLTDAANVQLGGALGEAYRRGVARLREDPYRSAAYLRADLSLEMKRIFTNYSGDISGRFLEIASLTSPPGRMEPPTLPQLIDGLGKHQKADGHFGADVDWNGPLEPESSNATRLPIFWGHSRLLVGLLEAHRAFNQPELLRIARRVGDFYIATADRFLDPARMNEYRSTGTYAAGYPTDYFPGIEGLAKLYKVTRDAGYLRQAERMAAMFERFDKLPIDHSHGNLITHYGLLLLYEITDKPGYLERPARRWQEAVDGGYVWPTGGVGERFHVSCATDEGCSEADWLRLNLTLWRLTGQTKYFESAERLLENHYAMNRTANGGYGHHNFLCDADGPLLMQPAFTEAVWCCTFHGILGMHTLQTYLVVGSERAVAINFPADVTATVSACGGRWKATVAREDRPGAVACRVRIDAASSTGSVANVPDVLLRRPDWAEGIAVSDRGGKAREATVECGYVRLPLRPGADGELRVTFAFAPRIEDRRLHRLAVVGKATARHRSVVLCDGPKVLLANSAKPRPIVVLQVDSQGRPVFSRDKSGVAEVATIDRLDATHEQIQAALRNGPRLRLTPWAGAAHNVAAAIVFDAITVPQVAATHLHAAGSQSRASGNALPRIKASPNGRFLVTDNGKPFFWLADTGWWMTGIAPAEVDVYLAKRAKQQFSVIQFHCGRWVKDYAGRLPFRARDALAPDEEYWRNIDSIVSKAGDHGLYIALVPLWGDEYGRLFGSDAARAGKFGRWIGARYASRTNVLWIASGEHDAINGFRLPVTAAQKAVLTAAARGIREATGGRQLITVHPGAARTSSSDFHNEPWLDLNMLQSGHQMDSEAYNLAENHALITHDYGLSPVKPVLDGEPLYEDTPDAIWIKRDVDKPRAGAAAVRRKAYWSVFAGACGHTYGNNNVYGFFVPPSPGFVQKLPEGPGNRESWKTALDAPGGAQLIHLRALVESLPFLTQVPDLSLLASPAGSGNDHFGALRGDGYAMFYSPLGRSFSVRLDRLGWRNATLTWFDPRSGRRAPTGKLAATGVHTFDPPGEPGDGNDWVLVLERGG